MITVKDIIKKFFGKKKFEIIQVGTRAGSTWNNAEISFLKKSYFTMTAKDIGSAINRSEFAVRQKMYILRKKKGKR